MRTILLALVAVVVVVAMSASAEARILGRRRGRNSGGGNANGSNGCQTTPGFQAGNPADVAESLAEKQAAVRVPAPTPVALAPVRPVMDQRAAVAFFSAPSEPLRLRGVEALAANR